MSSAADIEIIDDPMDICDSSENKHRENKHNNSVPPSSSPVAAQPAVSQSGGCGMFNQTDCEICKGSLTDQKQVNFILPCNHVVHVKCIYQWSFYGQTCPSCRVPFDVQALDNPMHVTPVFFTKRRKLMKHVLTPCVEEIKKDKQRDVNNRSELFGEEAVPTSYIKEIVAQTKEKNQVAFDKVERLIDNKTTKYTETLLKKRKLDIDLRKGAIEIAKLNTKKRLLAIQMDLKAPLIA